MKDQFSRRHFLQTSGGIAIGAPIASMAETKPHPFPMKGKMLKTLKLGMVRSEGSLTDKFKLAKEAGFDGIELHCPGIDVEEAKLAIQESGLPVDGAVNNGHWQVRHTDPDPEIRANALKSLKDGLRDVKAVGGDTLLLVVGHGKDGPEKEIWDRSVENISKAVPLAEELGVCIAIENVWNHFCYDHEGDHTQSAEKLAKYVDAFDSPKVGMQFDIGNHWKYGSTGDWIRLLDKRIVKLDVKGFSRENGKFTKIGEGDLDFVDVCKALTEIKFNGWNAAEVGGGDLKRLKEVAANMDRVFGLS